MELVIPDGLIKEEVLKAVDNLGLVPKEQLLGKQIGIEEFRKKYCGRKSPSWVRTFIFDEFPETDFKNGGWVINPHGGRKTNIYEYEASKWMEDHKYDIDWNAKLER